MTSALALTQLPLSVEDYGCPVCQSILVMPVTLPCKHTFCKPCLTRLQDHEPRCPMCRASFQVQSDPPLNEGLQQFISQHFGQEVIARQAELRAENRADEDHMPMFVLDAVLYPGQSLPLHVFEPRYRLMLRRSLLSEHRRFGVLSIVDGKLAEYGSTAVIERYLPLPDGRSLITSRGERRFHVLESWDQDGYKVCKIEWMPDELGPPEQALQLSQQAYALLATRAGPKLAELAKENPMPSPTQDPLGFSYWIAGLFRSGSTKRQVALLTLPTAVQRLQVIVEALSR
jgi:Lon protease-like protein